MEIKCLNQNENNILAYFIYFFTLLLAVVGGQIDSIIEGKPF